MQVSPRPGGMGLSGGACGHGPGQLPPIGGSAAAVSGRCGRAADSVRRAAGHGTRGKWRRRSQGRWPGRSARTSPSPQRSHLPVLRASCSRSAGSSSPARPSTAMRTSRRSTPTWSADEVPLAAVYELARRITGEIRRRRLRAVARHRAAAEFRPPRRGGAASRWSRAMSTTSSGRWRARALPRLLRPTTTARIVADRPANIRTLERYLLLANDLPGLKFATTLKPSPTASECLDPDRRGHREAHRRDRRASTIAARSRAGPGSISARRRVNNMLARARGVHRHLGGHVPGRGAAISRRRLPPGAQQRGASPASSTQATASAGPAADSLARARLPHALDHRRGGPDLSGDPHARDESVPDRARLPDQ